MRSGNNIHVQQHKTNMINDAPFVAFFMRALTFVLLDEMPDVSILGLQWFILIPRLSTRGLTGRMIPNPNPNNIEKKIQDLEQKLPSLLQS